VKERMCVGEVLIEEDIMEDMGSIQVGHRRENIGRILRKVKVK
jgi:hypothetical protein